MKHAAVLLLVVLSAVFGFGRTASDKDTAHAVEGARQLRDSMSNPDSLQLSRVLITGKGICIDYRGRNGSGGMSTGYAVYEADKNLLFVDNSGVWQRACLFGNLAQRRDGKDVTEAVSGALKRQIAPALKGQQELQEVAVRPVLPAVSGAIPAPTAHAGAAPARIVTAPTVQAVAPTAPVGIPAPTAQTPAAAVVRAPITTAPVGRPAVPARPVGPLTPAAHSPVAAIAPAPAPPPQPQPAAAAPVDTGIVRDVIIVGPDGAVPGTPSQASPESLGDAARRLKKEKQQKQQKQMP